MITKSTDSIFIFITLKSRFQFESLPETDDDDIAVLLTKGVKQGRFSNSTSQMHEIPMFHI